MGFRASERDPLWTFIQTTKVTITKPRLLVGDWNVVLSADEKETETGESVVVGNELAQVLADVELIDLPTSDCCYT